MPPSRQSIHREVKIGEPRMDSGMTIESERRPPFNPLEPMLPQEICWILDRAFACEVIRNSPCRHVPTFMYSTHVALDGVAHRLQFDANSLHPPICSPSGRSQPGLHRAPTSLGILRSPAPARAHHLSTVRQCNGAAEEL